MLGLSTCAGQQSRQRRSRLTSLLVPLVASLVACAGSPQADLAPKGLEAPANDQVLASSPVWEIAGTSVQGREIRSLTLGQGRRKVLYIGGIHGDEPEGANATAALPGEFLAAGLSEAVTLTVVEDANPDGRAMGTRVNANHVDLNRNFPARNFDGTVRESGQTPLNQPESRAVHNVIEKVRPDLVIAMHSWDGRQFVNFDGPARAIAERFSATSGLPVAESTSFSATPGSLGSYLGRDRGLPLITIELLKGSDPERNWELIRDALIEAIAGHGP